MKNTKLIKELNNALSLELRAIILYSHYSAYVQGIHRHSPQNTKAFDKFNSSNQLAG